MENNIQNMRKYIEILEEDLKALRIIADIEEEFSEDLKY